MTAQNEQKPAPRPPGDFPKAAYLSGGAELFIRARKIPGFFNMDDAQHFSLLLGHQNIAGPHGDILEIGTYFGRSAAILASFIRPGEGLVVCDAYNDHAVTDRYKEYPSSTQFRDSLHAAVPTFDLDRLTIHSCLSKDLSLSADARFRFVHIDGGHSAEEALGDLNKVANHVLDRGILVVDDYNHPQWPGVTQAVETFLSLRPDFAIVASMNRQSAVGQKLYLMRTTPETL